MAMIITFLKLSYFIKLGFKITLSLGIFSIPKSKNFFNKRGLRNSMSSMGDLPLSFFLGDEST